VSDTDYAPGDRIYRWWDSGAMGAELQALTVVRSNRLTVTVDTDHGGRFRLPFAEIAGRLTPDIDPRND